MRTQRTRNRATSSNDESSYIHAGHLLVVCALCLSTLALLGAPIPTGKPANYPGWWFSRGVIVPLPTTNTAPPIWTNSYPLSDDYAVINQGQLKNLATQAYNELQARLPSSVWWTTQGQALTSLVTVWNPESGDAYAAVNLGQLKTVAKPFYDLLAQSGYPNSAYPWTGTNADDYAVANIGQAKLLFSFDMSLTGPSNLTATNGAGGVATLYWTLPSTNYATSLLVEEQTTNGTWNVIGTLTNSATTSYTVTGLTEGQNYSFQIVGSGTNTYSVPISLSEAYHSSYYGGTLPTLAISSGNNQTLATNTFAALPLVVQVTRSGTNLVSAPVVFSLAPGSDGGFATNSGGTTSPSLAVLSNGSGQATVYYQSGAEGVANNVIVASAYAGSTSTSTNFIAYCGVQSGMTAWYRADNGVTATNAMVIAWNDQSTNGDNLAASAGTNAPTQATDPVTDKPVVQFNGYQSISSSSGVSGLTNATIIAVASNPTPGVSQAIVDVGNTSISNPTMGLVYASGNQSFVSGWSGGAALINNGGQAVQSSALALNTVMCSGGLASFYSDGVANGTAAVSTGTVSGGISLGALANYYDWNGTIAEALVYNRVLTSTERQQVEGYLANKYSILPVISSATKVNGTSGIAFTYTVTASNGATSFSAKGLPSGLSINSTTGVISGTPTTAGTSTVAITAANSVGVGSAILNLTIYPASPPVITSSPVAVGIVGQPFNFTIVGSNGPTNFTATGLPSPLTVNSSGLISGTPSAPSTNAVSVSAINAYGTGTNSLTVVISPGPTNSGLVAWYNGNVGVTATNGMVTAWNDQSTNQYNVAPPQYPTYSPVVTNDAASGNSVLSFNGSQSLSMTNSATTLACTNDITIITAASTPIPNALQCQVLVGAQPGNLTYLDANGYQGVNSDGTNYAGGPLTGGLALNVGSMTYSRASHALSFYYQGMANGTTNTTTAPSLSSGLAIGSNASGGPYYAWTGNIGDLLIYNSVLNTTQRQAVELYLANKYGLYAPGAAWIGGYSSAIQSEINRNQWSKAQADAYYALQANNPSMLTTGLKLWVKADSGVTLSSGSNVQGWADQTGNYPLTQTNVVAQPTLATNDCNGYPAIRFSGVSGPGQVLANTASLGSGVNADMTIITVGMTLPPTANSSSQYTVYLGDGTTQGASRALGYNNSLEYFSTVGTTNSVSGAAAVPAETFAAEAASLDSTLTNVTFYQNGTMTTTGTVGGALNVTPGVSVGSWWQGDICEALVYDHKLSTTELNQVSLYLANKYGLYFNNSYGTASWISGYSSTIQTLINANQWNSAQAAAYAQIATILPGTTSTGLVAWYKADSGVIQNIDTQAVTSWRDSGLYHHDLTQSNTNDQPTVVIDPTTGTRTVHFNGASTFLANSDSYPSITNATIVTLDSTTNNSSDETSVSLGYGYMTDASSQRVYLNHYGSQAFSQGASYYTSITYGGSFPATNVLTASALTYSAANTNITFFTNGAPNGSPVPLATGAIPTPVSSALALGSDNNSPYAYLPWNGNISEVLIYNRILSNTEIGELQTNYFNGKYTPYPVSAPTISLSSTNNAVTPKTVTMSGAASTNVIDYTLDGSTPTGSSSQYTAPFSLTNDCVVNCAVFHGGAQISQMATSTVWVGDTYAIGIPDSWQTTYFGSVTNLNVNTNAPGGSGLTYLQAYQWGYNPTKFSSNGDGLSDLVNHLLGYAGTNTDLNNYGLSNAQQLALGLDPFDVGVNPPLAAPLTPSTTNAPTIILTQPSTNVIQLP